jgi:hypothetical protein
LCQPLLSSEGLETLTQPDPIEVEIHCNKTPQYPPLFAIKHSKIE